MVEVQPESRKELPANESSERAKQRTTHTTKHRMLANQPKLPSKTNQSWEEEIANRKIGIMVKLVRSNEGKNNVKKHCKIAVEGSNKLLRIPANEFPGKPSFDSIILFDKVSTSTKVMSASQELMEKIRGRFSILDQIPCSKSFEFILRLLSLSAVGLDAIARKDKDKNIHTTKITITSEDTVTHFTFQLTESVKNSKVLSKWKPRIQFLVFAGRDSAIAIVKRITVVSPTEITVYAKAKGPHGKKIRHLVQSQEGKTLNVCQHTTSNDPVIEILRTHMNKSSKEKAAFTECNSICMAAFNALYGGTKVTYSKVDYNQPTHMEVNRQQFELSSEQNDIINAAKSELSLFAVIAAFGSGKTQTTQKAIAEEAISCENDSSFLHISTSQTNNAVVNSVEAASNLTEHENFNILRVISEANFCTRSNHTNYDLPIVLRRTLRDPANMAKLTASERIIVNGYLGALTEVTDENFLLLDSVEKWTKLIMAEENPSRSKQTMNEIIKIFLKFYRPKRIFCTTATLLGTFAAEDSVWPQSVRSVWIDEASQLPEGTFFAVTAAFPTARIVLIGDPRQLPPYAPMTKASFLPEIASGNLLQRVVDQELIPTFPLNGVYRCHPEMTTLLSKTFYDSQLKALALSQDRSTAIEKIVLPNKTLPWAVIAAANTKQVSTGTSWRNESEADAIRKIFEKVLLVHFEPSELAIITLYLAQVNHILGVMAHIPRGKEIFVGTADSAQGREWKVVVVNTVRTASIGNTDFFSDSKRVNVALSRAREACIIVGDDSLIRKTPQWRKVFEDLEKQNAVATINQFLEDNRDATRTSN